MDLAQAIPTGTWSDQDRGQGNLYVRCGVPRTRLKFYLGTHVINWLEKTDVPLFISYRQLSKRRSYLQPIGRWALDSGGFSELSLYGRWVTPHWQYVRDVRSYREEMGNLDWVAPQDWMCEPWLMEKTGLTIREHQRRTVRSFLRMRENGIHEAIPVLQGWTLRDYARCYVMYSRHGVDLTKEPTVGVGSVCRRQATVEIQEIMQGLHRLGLNLHGFGVKTLGLQAYASSLVSVDSLAWSFAARRSAPLPGHTSHINCANCLEYALLWRQKLLDKLEN